MLRRGAVWCSILSFWAVCGYGQQFVVSGRVTDENGAPVGQARINVRSDKLEQPLRAVADPTGAFSLALPAPGDYAINVQREGYFKLNYRGRLEAGQELALVLNPLREVFQTVDVHETPSRVNLDQTAREERLTGTEINDVPYPASHSLRNAMRLLPGVVQDTSGALHFAGSAENQVYYTLNDFSIADPLTGRFNTLLAVEGIRDLDFESGQYPVEFGRGSAGTLAIKTDTGTDRFRYTATNFLPGIDTQGGLHLGNWTPRVGVSGPIWRGRAWFADNFSTEYSQAVVNGLPKGEDRRSGWTAGNLLHTQVNLTPSQILFADFLVNYGDQGRLGLGPLDPVSTTFTSLSHEYFASVKDQIYFGHGTLVEFGYAHSSFFDQQMPVGQGLYIVAPAGRSGYNFINSSQWTSRDQALVNAYPSSFRFGGTHQLKIGSDVERLGYRADFARTGYERLGLANNVISTTVFQGNGAFERPGLVASWYALDTWRPRGNVRVEAGIRQDWDQLARTAALSPRASVSWSPAGGTRLSAGYAITRDTAHLALFGMPLDQYAVTTYPTTGIAQATTFFIGNGLRLPRYQNWSAGMEQELPHRLVAKVDYLRRSGRDGFAWVNTSAPDAIYQPLFGSPGLPGAYALGNGRRDRYQSVTASVRQTFAEQYEWMASYTRSRAQSNALLDITVDQSFALLNDFVAQPWDTPNRFLGFAYLPLPRKNWAVAALVDARSGFPYSAMDETGRIIGPVDGNRFPFNFDLNLHLERRFTFHGYRLAIRAGFNNITDHPNPTAVNNTVGYPQYLQFLGNEGRHFVVRLRVFGKSKGQ
ncbi:MAG: carboxypeptidase regulatory-like domain-containing protein [Acidobacteria bacterium]|nr:carboxypeptidase regulatory-like domain-containing protein [Acidobacteriota bacterium]